VAGISVTLLSLSFGSLWINAVGLKSIAADLGGSRSAPSLANSLAVVWLLVGGLAMGRLAERYGIRWTVLFGGVSVCIGLFISTLGQPWQLYVGHGIFMVSLAIPGSTRRFMLCQPLVRRRRGSALALISSGSYLAARCGHRSSSARSRCSAGRPNGRLRPVRNRADHSARLAVPAEPPELTTPPPALPARR